jgi:hypothetical protein
MMATYYRGLRTARPPRIAVVGHELISEIGDGTQYRSLTWCLTLACGHTRKLTAGRRCGASNYGHQIIHGERFLHVPKSLNCAVCAPLPPERSS